MLDEGTATTTIITSHQDSRPLSPTHQDGHPLSNSKGKIVAVGEAVGPQTHAVSTLANGGGGEDTEGNAAVPHNNHVNDEAIDENLVDFEKSFEVTPSSIRRHQLEKGECYRRKGLVVPLDSDSDTEDNATANQPSASTAHVDEVTVTGILLVHQTDDADTQIQSTCHESNATYESMQQPIIETLEEQASLPMHASILPVQQEVPAVPVQQEVPAVPVQQEVPAVPVQQEVPAVPVQQEVPAVPVQQEVPAVPVQQEVPAVPVQQEVPAVPVQQEVPAVPVQQEVPAVPVQQEVPAVPVQQEVPAVPVQQEVPAVPVQQEVPAVPVQQEVPAVPVQQEVPAVPVQQEVPAVPVQQEVPAVPVQQEVPAVPVQQEVPAVPVQQEVPAVPVQQEVPAVPTSGSTSHPMANSVLPHAATITGKQSDNECPDVRTRLRTAPTKPPTKPKPVLQAGILQSKLTHRFSIASLPLSTPLSPTLSVPSAKATKALVLDITSVPPQATPIDSPQATPIDPPQATPIDPPQATPIDPPQATPSDPPQATPIDPPQATPSDPPQATPIDPLQTTPSDPSQDTPIDPAQPVSLMADHSHVERVLTETGLTTPSSASLPRPLDVPCPRQGAEAPCFDAVAILAAGVVLNPSVTSQGVEPSVTSQGVVPPVTSQGVEPLVTSQGLVPPVTSQGVEPCSVPLVTSEGVEPPVTSEGVEPPVTSEGVEPPVTSQGVEPPVTSQGVEPPVTSQGVEPCSVPPITSQGVEPCSLSLVTSADVTVPAVNDGPSLVTEHMDTQHGQLLDKEVSNMFKPLASSPDPSVSLCSSPMLSAGSSSPSPSKSFTYPSSEGVATTPPDPSVPTVPEVLSGAPHGASALTFPHHDALRSLPAPFEARFSSPVSQVASVSSCTPVAPPRMKKQNSAKYKTLPPPRRRAPIEVPLTMSLSAPPTSDTTPTSDAPPISDTPTWLQSSNEEEVFASRDVAVIGSTGTLTVVLRDPMSTTTASPALPQASPALPRAGSFESIGMLSVASSDTTPPADLSPVLLRSQRSSETSKFNTMRPRVPGAGGGGSGEGGRRGGLQAPPASRQSSNTWSPKGTRRFCVLNQGGSSKYCTGNCGMEGGGGGGGGGGYWSGNCGMRVLEWKNCGMGVLEWKLWNEGTRVETWNGGTGVETVEWGVLVWDTVE